MKKYKYQKLGIPNDNGLSHRISNNDTLLDDENDDDDDGDDEDEEKKEDEDDAASVRIPFEESSFNLESRRRSSTLPIRQLALIFRDWKNKIVHFLYRKPKFKLRISPRRFFAFILVCLLIFAIRLCWLSVVGLMDRHVVRSILLMALTVFSECRGLQKAIEENKQPGLDLKMSQKGLNYVCQMGANVVLEKLARRHLPPQSGSEGDLSYSFSNMRISRVVAPLIKTPLVKGEGINVELEGLGMEVVGDWQLKFNQGIIKVSAHGSLRASASDVGLTAKIAILMGDRDPSPDSLFSDQGRPHVRSLGCHGRVGSISLDFSGGVAAWLLDLFRGLIEAKVERELPALICEETRDAIDVQANRQLSRLRLNSSFLVPLPLSAGGLPLDVDYRFLAPPSIDEDRIEARLKGEIFPRGSRQEAPFEPPKFDEATGDDKMITLHVSDFVFNSGFYSAYKSGKIDFWLSRENLPPERKEVLNTTCEASLLKRKGCVGTLAPSVARLFPNQSVVLNVRLASPPVMSITNETIETTAEIQILWFVVPFNRSGGNRDATSRWTEFKRRRANNEGDLGSDVNDDDGLGPRYLFTTNHTVTSQGRPAIVRERLTIHFRRLGVTVTLADAAIPMRDFHSYIFKMVLYVVSNSVVLPQLNRIGGKGIALPALEGLHFYNESIRLQKDAVLINCDLKYIER